MLFRRVLTGVIGVLIEISTTDRTKPTTVGPTEKVRIEAGKDESHYL